MYIDSALFNVDVCASHMIEELITRVGALGVGHKKLQQVELCRPHFYGLVLDKNTSTVDVEH